jgi:hypothetical protein
VSVRRTRLDRLWAAVAAVASVGAVPPTDVWLPVKVGSGQVPGRYSPPGGRMVLVLYDPDDPTVTEATA